MKISAVTFTFLIALIVRVVGEEISENEDDPQVIQKTVEDDPMRSRGGQCLRHLYQLSDASITTKVHWKNIAPGTKMDTLAQLAQGTEQIGFHT